MSKLLKKSRKKKTPLEKLKAAFNRLKKKNDRLHTLLNNMKAEYEEAFKCYRSEVLPREKECGGLICKFVERVQELTKKPSSLRSDERAALNEYLCESVDMIYSLLPVQEIPDSIKTLYTKLFGQSHEEFFQEECSDVVEMFKDEFGEDVDLDLSHLNPNDTPKEIMEKIFASFYEHREEIDEKFTNFANTKKKSEKELLEESKAKKLEKLQSKGLNNIYKKLAKVLHPDLEQDPKKRSEKENLMKRLTVAYKNNDLLLLLDLEKQWLGNLESSIKVCSEETLQAYNLLLKEQITEISVELELVGHNPRYFEMHKYFAKNHHAPLRGIQQGLKEHDELQSEYSQRLQDLSGPNTKALKHLKTVLNSVEDDVRDLDMFVDMLMDVCEQMENSQKKRGS